jgi:hypothetical protein
MKTIDETLREKEIQIKTLQREVDVLRAAARIVGDDSNRSASQRGNGVLSQPQMIRAVLLNHGRPLRVDRIAEAIKKKFKVRLKIGDATAVIYRAIRGRKHFRREGINTFGLIEWPTRRAGRRKK